MKVCPLRNSCTLLLAALCLAAAAGLASCSVGPNYSAPPVDMPGHFKAAASQPAVSAAQIRTNWWTLFNDPRLDELEAQALAGSFDLKAALARIDEARAARDIVRAGFFPTVNFNPSLMRSRPSANGAPPVTTNNLIQLPLDLNYEVDVWGKVRRGYEAADATYQASIADAAVIRLSLQSNVAVGFLNLRSLDAQEQILIHYIEQFRHQVDLTERQKRAGMVDQTAVAQARTQLDSTLPQLQEVRRQRADQEHALAVLLGRPPSELSLATDPLTGQQQPPVIPPGLPADLLAHRPDVAEAEQNLVAANAQIGVAVSAFLPNVQLAASVGYGSVGFGNALQWNNHFWSVGPTASVPIFEGGALVAGLAQARGHYAELMAAYRGVLVGAFRDVEDALNDIRYFTEESESLDRAIKSAREYARLAEDQYKGGLINYLTVVDAYRTLLTNELSAAQTLNQRMASTVLLIKAVGGGCDVRSPAASQPD